MRETRPPQTYHLTRAVFLRGLGATCIAAFVSLWVQVDGLVGRHGIAPVQELLAFAGERLGVEAFHRVPTLLWIDASDPSLYGLCAAGTILGALLAAGVPPVPLLVALWAAYLSFASVAGVFLGYQWDALLLETLFFAVPFAWSRAAPSRAGLFLLRWLLFRLLFLSGLVKLLSGDPAWRDLTALSYHWWTQPLPAWPAAFAAELPAWIQAACVLATFAVELVAPLGVFGPRRARLVACAAIAGLQLAIAATGTYGFFNLLTLVLSTTLLDDAALRAFVPRRLRREEATAYEPAPRPGPAQASRLASGPRVAGFVAAATLVAATALAALDRIAPRLPLPGVVAGAMAAVEPFRTLNAYGLFAVMTKERPEIGIEGSADGVDWQEYVFRWKPGPRGRRPAFATPHMPRLDWQMWFAALSRCEREPWLHAFLVRLLQGEPAVTGLLERDPFAGSPPRYLRLTLWKYRFAPAADRHRGVWWTREAAGPYCPAVELRDGRLRLAEGVADGP